MTEQDPFLEYYNLTNPPAPAPKGKVDDLNFLADLEPAITKSRGDVVNDAKAIKTSVSAFIQTLNKTAIKLLEDEKAKGTRPDLIVTMVLGGLAFVLANMFYLINKTLGAAVTEQDYFTSFMGMYRTAMRDIKRSE